MRFTILFLVFASFATVVRAQGYVDLLPDEVTQPYYARRDSISEALKKDSTNEWAGWYSTYAGETWSQALLWGPEVGFAAYRDTCSYGPRAWVNHGKVRRDNQGLTLFPDRSEGDENLLEFDETEFAFIKWDEQHWLVPKADLALFAYAINSRSGIEYEVGYIKTGDGDKRRRGQPDLPTHYKKLLGLPPINVKVRSIDEAKDDWFPTMTIDAGRNKRIIKGMSFWLTGQKGVNVRVEVTDVGEQSSMVSPRMVGRTADFDQEVVPKIGWRFSSRGRNLDR